MVQGLTKRRHYSPEVEDTSSYRHEREVFFERIAARNWRKSAPSASDRNLGAKTRCRIFEMHFQPGNTAWRSRALETSIRSESEMGNRDYRECETDAALSKNAEHS